MVTTGLSADEAFAVIREQRPEVHPEVTQVEAVEKFAAQWIKSL